MKGRTVAMNGISLLTLCGGPSTDQKQVNMQLCQILQNKIYANDLKNSAILTVLLFKIKISE